jgi:hypothetical protein
MAALTHGLQSHDRRLGCVLCFGLNPGCVGVPTLSENGTDAGEHGRINWFQFEPCRDEFCCLDCLVDAGDLGLAVCSPNPNFVLNYDPPHAALPNQKLTPGDTFSGVTAADVCTPGWASEHRHVTESMRDEVYAEYDRTRGPDCCEVDHLSPLELGGSNDIRNLWPQPDAPRPGWAEKDQLENELHAEVCAGKMPLADAQRCIASNLGPVLGATRRLRIRRGMGCRKPPQLVIGASSFWELP